jgi:hypothetical protein
MSELTVSTHFASSAPDIVGFPRIALDGLARNAILGEDDVLPLEEALVKFAVFNQLLTTELAPVD